MKKTTANLYSIFTKSVFKANKNVFRIIALNIVAALSQLLVYTLINHQLGKATLGIWSLIVAVNTIGQIGNFSFSNALVRFIPDLIIDNDKSSINKMVGTVNVLNLIFTFPALIILYFSSSYYANHLLNASQYEVFIAVFNWTILAVFVGNLFSVYACLFDGFQKYYVRSSIQMGGWVFFLLLSFLLIPRFQLQGVGIAFLFQNLFQLIAAMVLSLKHKMLDRRLPISFEKKIFKQISTFGIKFQSVGILAMFMDPIIKYFITQKVGLTGTANFELANKITVQFRNLMVSANQILIPKFVSENANGNINSFFSISIQKNTISAVFLGLITLLISPLAIYFFSKKFDPELMLMISIINIGWVCNMITSAHYYAAIALDKVGSLLVLHFIYAGFTVFAYLISRGFSTYPYVYMIIPTISLVFGSIYNSMILSKIKDSFYWTKSILLFSFLAISLLFVFVRFNEIWKVYVLLIFGCFIIILFNFKKIKEHLNRTRNIIRSS